MTPKTAGWDELHLSENPAVELLESLGYTYVRPEDLEPERASLKETILAGRLATALKRLNPWLSDTNIVTAIKAVTQVPATSLAEANEKLYTSLTYGIALEQDRGDGRKSHTVEFLDFDNPGNNECDRHPPIPGARVEKTRHPRHRHLRQRTAARDHRVQEPHEGRRVEIRGGPATPPLPGTRDALEGPRGAEALRGGADPRRYLRRARGLRHGGHGGAVLPGVEGALPTRPQTVRIPTRGALLHPRTSSSTDSSNDETSSTSSGTSSSSRSKAAGPPAS